MDQEVLRAHWAPPTDWQRLSVQPQHAPASLKHTKLALTHTHTRIHRHECMYTHTHTHTQSAVRAHSTSVTAVCSNADSVSWANRQMEVCVWVCVCACVFVGLLHRLSHQSFFISNKPALNQWTNALFNMFFLKHTEYFSNSFIFLFPISFVQFYTSTYEKVSNAYWLCGVQSVVLWQPKGHIQSNYSV